MCVRETKYDLELLNIFQLLLQIVQHHLRTCVLPFLLRHDLSQVHGFVHRRQLAFPSLDDTIINTQELFTRNENCVLVVGWTTLQRYFNLTHFQDELDLQFLSKLRQRFFYVFQGDLLARNNVLS